MIQPVISLNEYSMAELRFSQVVADRGYVYSVTSNWEGYKPKYQAYLDKIGVKNPTLVFEESEDNSAVLYEIDKDHDSGLVALVDLSKREIKFTVASSNKNVINKHIAQAKKIFPPVPDSADDRVKVRFWYVTNSGPRNVTREIVVPKWEHIAHNYSAATTDELNFLMNDFHPSGGGQLIVFTGLPGVGKSYLLRALLQSWKDWCTPQYILDPENLFGGSQGYMASLVLNGSASEYDEPEDEEEIGGKWKLLILEDSGDLLMPDAKNHTGQGPLSRLLNLVDGLIGQGLRVLVLITTNEEITKLHPAVSREGRCAAAVNFKPFTREEAEVWLGGKKELPAGQKFTLSELYGLTRDKKVGRISIPETKSLGFKMRSE